MSRVRKLSVMIDYSKCTGCTLCVYACQKGIIRIVKKGIRGLVEIVNKDLCSLCMSCVLTCPSGAVRVVRQFVS